MRYNRTRPESRINTGFSLISSKRSAGKSTGGEDDFRSLGGERRLLSKSKGELVKIWLPFLYIALRNCSK